MKTLMESINGKGPARSLREAAELRSQQVCIKAEIVARARSAELSQATIALCLGMSTRTAHKKYRKRG